jgi:pyrroloquinoline quinone biosynthesis protein B
MKRRDFFKTSLGSLAGAKSFFLNWKIPFSNRFKAQNEQLNKNVAVSVLGTAQDGGLPQIGCYCPNCQRARKDPSFSRLISSLALFDFKENKSFIIDATPDIRIQYDMVHKRIKKDGAGRKNAPDGIILTHAHIGHYTGLMFYGYESISSHKLPVYCSKRMGNFLARNGPWSQLVDYENISLRKLAEDKAVFLTENLSLFSLPVPHRDEFTDTLGFIVSGKEKKLLYIPDIQGWEEWSRPIEEVIKDVDIAILDGTFYSGEEFPGRDLSKIGHPFIVESMERLSGLVKDKKIYFSHLNHSNLALPPEGNPFKTIHDNGFALAEEGMEFIL